jgi:polysaccharide export outer membrane protein
MTLLPLILMLILLQAPSAKGADSDGPKPEAPTTYTLGSGDQLVIRAVDVEEIDNKPVVIDTRGNINLPIVGRIHAAGLTPEGLETEIGTRLKKYVNDPDVTVALAELRSQPISVLGSVQSPGVQQLQGQKTLFEVLSLAGGLRSDAGNTVKITRRIEWGRIPLPSAADDATGQFSIASVSAKSIMSATNPQDNIAVKPNDVISVPRGDIIYVIGAVHKAGGFLLGDNDSLGALQILSLAEGLDRTAAPKKARIMRAVPGSNDRTEIPIDLKTVLAGKGSDVPLKADDILFVPTNATKNAALRSMEIAISLGTGIAIYSVRP